MLQDESQCVPGRQGAEDVRVVGDVEDAEHCDHEEPHESQRSEKLSDAAGAPLLHAEEKQQYDERERYDVFAEGAGNHFQPFNRRKYRYGWSDHSVAIEERGAENAHQQQHLAQPGLPFDGLRRQCQHRDESSLTVVVGAQHQNHVFHCDDDDQRVEEHRHHAEHIGRRQRHMPRVKDLLYGIQDAGGRCRHTRRPPRLESMLEETISMWTLLAGAPEKHHRRAGGGFAAGQPGRLESGYCAPLRHRTPPRRTLRARRAATRCSAHNPQAHSYTSASGSVASSS